MTRERRSPGHKFGRGDAVRKVGWRDCACECAVVRACALSLLLMPGPPFLSSFPFVVFVSGLRSGRVSSPPASSCAWTRTLTSSPACHTTRCGRYRAPAVGAGGREGLPQSVRASCRTGGINLTSACACPRALPPERSPASWLPASLAALSPCSLSWCLSRWLPSGGRLCLVFLAC